MNRLTKLTIDRPITTLMVVLSVVVLGVICLEQIPLVFLPNISGNFLHVYVPYRSSSPEEVRRRITLPMEDMLATVPKLVSMRSDSSRDGAGFFLEFEIGTNMDLISMEVRDRIERARVELPSDVEHIYIRRWQTGDMPVMVLSLAWRGKDVTELYDAVDRVIQPQIERIEGVAGVQVYGILQKELQVRLSQDRLRALHVDQYLLRRSIMNNNLSVSAGQINDGDRRFQVRAVGEFKSVKEIANQPIAGTGITLSDVAEVVYDFPKRYYFMHLDGRDAVVMLVMKSSTANMVEVSTRINKALCEIQKQPGLENLRIRMIKDFANPIRQAITGLRNAACFGGLLVMLSIYLFLRDVRSTLIISTSIPLSVLATFGFMFIVRRVFGSDVTLNIISMMGLLLALGMLVDNAVVVLENIFRHRQNLGYPAREAAMLGAGQVGIAILAATMTTVCVFTPILFLRSTSLSLWMKDFAISFCTVMVASLFVALTLIPLVASRILTKVSEKESLFIRIIRGGYARLIKVTIRWRFLTLGIAILVMIASFYIYKRVPQTGVHHAPSREIRFNIELPRGFYIEETKAFFERIEKLLEEHKKELEIENIMLRFWPRGGQVHLFFVPETQSKHTTDELTKKIREILPKGPGIKYRIGRRHGMSGQSMGLTLLLKGSNLETLASYADRFKNALEKVDGVLSVDTDLESGTEEIRVSVQRRRAQKLGLSAQRIAWGVSAALANRANSKFKTQDREIDINIQLREEDRTNLEHLKNMAFRAGNKDIPFDRLASFKFHKGPRTIRRFDRQSTVQVFVNFAQGKSLQEMTKKIMGIVSTIPLPPGYSCTTGQELRRMQEDQTEMLFGLALALMLVYMIMASLFESLLHPFTIMLSIPFAFTGVGLIFYATGLAMDDLARIGILVLCGVVVNNAIVLIDYTNRLRKDGREKNEAIIQACHDRLRPILITALTTIVGLLPMVMPVLVGPIRTLAEGHLPVFIGSAVLALLDWGAQHFPTVFRPAEGMNRTWAPMSVAVVGGLLSSTVLSLVLLPTLYSIVDDISKWFRGLIRVVTD